MRYLNKLIWSALIAGATAAPAFAQGGGGGAMGGGGGGAGAGGGLGGGSGGGSGGANSGVALTALSATPQINAPTASGGNTGNSVSTSNFLSQYFANPYYQGVLTNSQNSNNMPGGFGTVLFNGSGSSTTGGGQIGFAGTTGGATASRGATAGGARGGTGSTNSSSGVVIALPVQISYAAIPKFKIDPVAPAQLQADLIAMLRRSKEVSFPATVQLSTAGNVVTVRGNAKDRDEARSIESMILLTPGVRSVKNELSYPKE